MSEEEEKPEEGQKDEKLSPKDEQLRPTARGKQQPEDQNQKPVVKGSESTDNLKPHIKSNEDASQPQPATPSTLNPKPSTSNMEVHHHAHSQRKKWTHYFWEFLMLFLAVFCGFLAENQREHYIEALRAKEYAKSLLEDLKEDTAEISGGIHQNAFMISAFDSCISTGLNHIDKQAVPGMFYYYSKLIMTTYSIDWNASTLTQLLQSGNLRYFKNKELVKKINRYYALHGLIGSNNEIDMNHRMEIMLIRNRLLLPEYYQVFAPLEIHVEMKAPVHNETVDKLKAQELPLKPGSNDVMAEYLNNLMDRRARNVRYVEELYPNALNAAQEIIQLLIKEYHLHS
jgi:hypothetical protein